MSRPQQAGAPSPDVKARWVRAVIAESEALMALHFPNRHGDCVRCVQMMPMAYPNTPRTFPCGPHQIAAEMAERRLARIDPTGAIRRELNPPAA